MTTNASMESNQKEATKILEIELWDLTLKKLEEPEDLYAAHNACDTFGKLLKQRRAAFLFPMVFPILMDEDIAVCGNTGSSINLLDGLLPLRSVCTYWKSGVNQYLQGFNHIQDYEKESPYADAFSFGTADDVERFMEKMTSHTSNDDPFFTGMVTLDDDSLSDDELIHFWEAVNIKLLPKFGNHISFCKIDCQNIFEVEVSLGYSVLQRVLQQMPALLFLHLSAEFEEHTDLPNLVDRAPLTNFQDLTSIHIMNCGVTVTTELLRASRKCDLQVLTVELFDEDADQFNSSCWNSICQLTSLKRATLPGYSSFKSLVMLCKARWSITNLNLAITLFDDDNLPLPDLNFQTRPRNLVEDHISLPRLFHVLSYLGHVSTIRDLRLHLLGAAKVGIDLRLKLPHLENLEMICEYGQIVVNSLDFAVEMKSLKCFDIAVRDNLLPSQENTEEIIKFSGYLTDMKKSNIWTVLPNLEELYLTTKDGSGIYNYMEYQR